MQKPVRPRRKTIPPTAIPTLAPRVSPRVETEEDPVGVVEEEVMFVRVVEKREPFMEIVFPGVGCC
jgi:hypothetical protein